VAAFCTVFRVFASTFLAFCTPLLFQVVNGIGLFLLHFRGRFPRRLPLLHGLFSRCRVPGCGLLGIFWGAAGGLCPHGLRGLGTAGKLAVYPAAFGGLLDALVLYFQVVPAL